MSFIKTGTPHPLKNVYANNEKKITQLCELCNKNEAEFHVNNKRVCKECKDSIS